MNIDGVGRRLALWFGLVAWLYAWYLIRGLRQVYSGEGIEIGSMPTWLLLVMVLTSSSLLGCAVCAGMRVPAWRGLSITGGLALFGLTVLGQFAVMDSLFVRDVSLGAALNQVLETRGSVNVALFVAGIPTVLVLAGLSGFVAARLGMDVPDQA